MVGLFPETGPFLSVPENVHADDPSEVTSILNIDPPV